MFLGATQVAFAYNTFGDHVLNGGVGNYGYSNRYYYVSVLQNHVYGELKKKSTV